MLRLAWGHGASVPNQAPISETNLLRRILILNLAARNRITLAELCRDFPSQMPSRGCSNFESEFSNFPEVSHAKNCLEPLLYRNGPDYKLRAADLDCGREGNRPKHYNGRMDGQHFVERKQTPVKPRAPQQQGSPEPNGTNL